MEEFNIDDFGTDLPTQLTQPYENHSQRGEVEIDDIQWSNYLNDIHYNSNSEALPLDEMPRLDENKDAYKEDEKTELNVSVEDEFRRTEETLLLEETMPEQLVEKVGDECQNSDAPPLNVESNGIENLNIQTDPCERKISTSLKINEMSNTNAKRKRKKSNLEGEDKSIPFCNCKKSKCLKLYCECFSAGVYCTKDCGCTDCMNQEIFEDTVKTVKQQIQSKNPVAFAPKNVRMNGATFKKRCKCKQSMCRKGYCECFQAGIGCTIECGCESCHNPFGIGQGSNNIGDGMRNNVEGSSSLEYKQQQLPINLSPSFSNNLPALVNQHTPDTPTSNISNENGDSEASNLGADTAQIYELLYGSWSWSWSWSCEISQLLQQLWTENDQMVQSDHQQSNFAPMSSNRPPRNSDSDHLLYQPSTSTYVQEGQLSSNSNLSLTDNQQGVTQNIPNFTSSVTNLNGGSFQNGGDPRKFS